jgi:presenilin-like A22 family membrane protease
MKHALKVTLIIIAMFLVAQFIGLGVMTSYDNHFGPSAQKARQEAIEKGLPVPPEPEISVIRETIPPKAELKEPIDVARIITSIVIAIIFATALFFLLSRIRVTVVLRIWFALVVFICLSIAFTLALYPIANIPLGKFILADVIALLLALILTFYKIVKRNMIVHNFTELFIYPGLAVIFLPLLNVLAAAILLIAISIYDMWAVWKSKYMIKLAKFQINQMKIFTGFFVPYVGAKDKIKIQRMRALELREKKDKRSKKQKKQKGKPFRFKVQIAALGGGDVAFPLIFAGTILLTFGFLASIITVLCTTLALWLLLWFSKKGRFYPAMPFLSAGCFLGLAIVLLLF